ncbi:hypothetical protein A0257_21500 [Hymenobacter psoromatis]|nr:hypothetical protein A0257_21500 [Hymenobacter psoromatis]
MKKLLTMLAAVAALASCREANTGVQSRPNATAPSPEKVLRFDTTFVKPAVGARAYPHTYTGSLLVGATKKVPVQIDWTTTGQAGCPQVASVRVFQLNALDRRTHVSVQALRDAVCKPGPQPAGNITGYTGSAYLKITCDARDIHRVTSTTLTLNGLGYHDTLGGDSATASVR